MAAARHGGRRGGCRLAGSTGGGFADILFSRSLDWGFTWLSQSVHLNVGTPQGSGLAHFSRLAATGGTVVALWTDHRDGFYPDPYVNVSTDFGATWLSAEIRLNPSVPAGTEGAYFPAIAASGPFVCAVWRDRTSAIRFNRSADGGKSWLPAEVRVDQAPPGSSRDVPAVAVSSNRVYVAWADDRSDPAGSFQDIYCNRSLDGGVTWNPVDLRLNTGMGAGTASAWGTVLAATGAGVYGAWSDARDGLFDIYCNVPFAAEPYGQGTAGTGGIVPRLGFSGLPLAGSAATVDVTSGAGGTSGILLAGVTGRASFPFLGGMLLVMPPHVFVPFTLGGPAGVVGAGAQAIAASVPPNAQLVGTRFDFQAVLLDPGAPSGAALTNGLEVWVG